VCVKKDTLIPFAIESLVNYCMYGCTAIISAKAIFQSHQKDLYLYPCVLVKCMHRFERNMKSERFIYVISNVIREEKKKV